MILKAFLVKPGGKDSYPSAQEEHEKRSDNVREKFVRRYDTLG